MSRRARADWLWATAAGAAAMLIAIAGGARRGLWVDEYHTLYAAGLSLREMAIDRLDAGHSPLYFIYARAGLWLSKLITGADPSLATGISGSERALRFTSAIAELPCVLALTGLIIRANLRRALPMLWIFCVLQPAWITSATQFRYMMPLLAVVAAALWAALAWMEKPTWRAGAALTSLLTVALWIHASAQLLLPGLVVAMLWQSMAAKEKFRAMLWRLAPVTLAFILSLPLLYMIRKHGVRNGTEWVGVRLVADYSLAALFGDDRLWPARLGLPWLSHALVAAQIIATAAGLWLAARALRGSREMPLFRLCVPLAVVVPLSMLATCLLVRRFAEPRYLAVFSLPMLPLWAVAATRGILNNGAAKARWLFATPLVLLLAAQCYATAILDRGDPYRDVVKWLIANAGTNEPIVASVPRTNTVALQFYGLPNANRIIGFKTDEADPGKLAPRLAAVLKQATQRTHGLFVVYDTKAALAPAFALLQTSGTLAAQRTWPISSRWSVGAWTRSHGDADAQWLAGLAGPKLYE